MAVKTFTISKKLDQPKSKRNVFPLTWNDVKGTTGIFQEQDSGALIMVAADTGAGTRAAVTFLGGPNRVETRNQKHVDPDDRFSTRKYRRLNVNAKLIIEGIAGD